MQRVGFWGLLCLCAAVWGCGGPAAGPGAPTKVTLPETPDGVMQTVMTAVVTDEKPQALWVAMPPKYQADVKGLIGDFANKMDKDLWDKSFVVLGKLVNVAKNKKEYIIAIAKKQGDGGPVNMDELSKNWDNVVLLLEAISTSEIKTVDGLKKVDPEAFLGTTVATLIKHGKKMGKVSDDAAAALAKVQKAKVTLVKTEGDKATIKVETEGEKAEEMQLTKVEGKWVPADLAANWDANIKEAKDGIAGLDFQGPGKAQYLGALGFIEPVLDSLLEAKNEKEFEAALQASPLGMFLGGPPSGLDAPKGFDAPPGLDPPKKAEDDK